MSNRTKLLYIYKLIISYLIEILVFIFTIKNIFLSLINLNNFFKRSNTKKYKENILVIFKSGTMGDHLICIDCLSFIKKIYKFDKIFIVCREKSISKQIIKLAFENDIRFLNYIKFLNFVFKKRISNDKFYFIDTEPNFRVGLLFKSIFIKATLFSNIRFQHDLLSQRFLWGYTYNKYEPNMQEGGYILRAILKSIKNDLLLTDTLNLSNNYLHEFKNKKLIQSKKYFNSEAYDYHQSILNKYRSDKEFIYLYYGCSGKALHRLPPFNWFLNFISILEKEFQVILVGGSLESKYIEKIPSNIKVISEFIGKFSLSEWSSILSYSEKIIPLISFDGGFSHIYGIHQNQIYQIFCSSNSKKWKNKSDISGVFECLKGGSPIYKPYEFKVPESCDLSNNAWLNTHYKDVFKEFFSWYKNLEIEN